MMCTIQWCAICQKDTFRHYIVSIWHFWALYSVDKVHGHAPITMPGAQTIQIAGLATTSRAKSACKPPPTGLP